MTFLIKKSVSNKNWTRNMADRKRRRRALFH